MKKAKASRMDRDEDKWRRVREAVVMDMTRSWDLKEAQKEFTCNDCDVSTSCPFAWDLYNLNGDCLAEK